MKKTLKYVLLSTFAWLFTLQAFAADGIKTTVKGNLNLKGVKVINIFKREMMRRPVASDTVGANGQFQLTMNLKESGFYIIADGMDQECSFVMYLNPGDQLTMKVENDNCLISGKGSEINQLLANLNQEYSYDKTDLTNYSKIYANRVNAINNSTTAAVLRKRSLLIGYTQGEYLSKLYTPYMESKGHPSEKGMMEVNTIDLNIRLVPEIVIYPNWYQLITELMFAKINAGQLTVSSISNWVADFGNAIDNEKLREQYIAITLDHSVSYGDLTAVTKEINAALPFIKNPRLKASVNALKAKSAQRLSFYKNTMPGTDFSAFTFRDIDGKQVKISDFKGKLIYIDIWTTGCMPCMAEAPYLAKLEQEMEGKDIVFLSISCDAGPEVWKRTIKQYNLTAKLQLLMNGGYNDAFFQKVGKSGVPRFLILDQAGKMLDFNSCKRPSNPLLKVYLTGLLNLPKA